jgi:hypothetical protein
MSQVAQYNDMWAHRIQVQRVTDFLHSWGEDLKISADCVLYFGLLDVWTLSIV